MLNTDLLWHKKSPLFPRCQLGTGLMFRTKFEDDRIKLECDHFTAEDCMPVKSIGEAEDRIIALVEPEQTFDPATFPFQGCVGDANAALSIQMNRSANLIASRTRRGAGNVALLHSDAFKILLAATTEALRAELDNDGPLGEQKAGRWKLVGTLNCSIKCYQCDDMPPDKIIVAFIGSEYDSPAQLLADGDGLHLHIAAKGEGLLGSAEDYLSAITIVS
jgi:hypothetical protein